MNSGTLNMNRFSLLGIALLASSLTSAAYNALQFNTTSGTAAQIGMSGLSIKFNGDSLVAVNGEGKRVSLLLEDVTSMQFVDLSMSSVEDVEATIAGEVNVYTLGGVVAGTFTSVNEAISTLDAGTYIVKDAAGKAYKIAVKR